VRTRGRPHAGNPSPRAAQHPGRPLNSVDSRCSGHPYNPRDIHSSILSQVYGTRLLAMAFYMTVNTECGECRRSVCCQWDAADADWFCQAGRFII
jgi:hypothetical protein